MAIYGLPRWHSDKEFACQCRRHKRHGFNPWVEKSPWRKAWQPTPIFFPWIQEPGRLQSMGFSRQEYWSGLPCPPAGDLPSLGIEPMSLVSPALIGGFSPTSTTWEAHIMCPSGLIRARLHLQLLSSSN